jgi:hypothetical protein
MIIGPAKTLSFRCLSAMGARSSLLEPHFGRANGRRTEF